MIVIIEGVDGHARTKQEYPLIEAEWVDYSDDESELEASPSPKRKSSEQPDPPSPEPPLPQADNEAERLYLPSREEVEDELDKLDELDDRRVDEVWLEMSAWDQEYLEDEMEFLRGKARRQGNIVSVYRAREKEAYHVKVYIKVAYDYIENGYDKSDRMRTIVADRNFERPRRHDDRPYRKKYVDKDPKEAPSERKELGSSHQSIDQYHTDGNGKTAGKREEGEGANKRQE